MNWIALEDYTQIQKALLQTEPFLVFKHSIRCSISSMVKHRFERAFDCKNVQLYFLDLITYRSISNQLADDFNVEHQSPQILLIKNGNCVYHASHNAIDADVIKDKI
tara:strand:- start:100 stop:420 length:321 start_codon:yes stop_codon:yes gene_type:complete